MAAQASCVRALSASRRLVGDAQLARDEQAVRSLHVAVSGDTASSPNPEAPAETSHYVYTAGRWRIG